MASFRDSGDFCYEIKILLWRIPFFYVMATNFFLLSSYVLRVDLISRSCSTSLGSLLDGALAILCLSNFMVFRPLPLAVTVDTVVQNKTGLWELNSSTCVLSRSRSLLFFLNNSYLFYSFCCSPTTFSKSCTFLFFGRKMYFFYALHHN